MNENVANANATYWAQPKTAKTWVPEFPYLFSESKKWEYDQWMVIPRQSEPGSSRWFFCFMIRKGDKPIQFNRYGWMLGPINITLSSFTYAQNVQYGYIPWQQYRTGGRIPISDTLYMKPCYMVSSHLINAFERLWMQQLRKEREYAIWPTRLSFELPEGYIPGGPFPLFDGITSPIPLQSTTTGQVDRYWWDQQLVEGYQGTHQWSWPNFMDTTTFPIWTSFTGRHAATTVAPVVNTIELGPS